MAKAMSGRHFSHRTSNSGITVEGRDLRGLSRWHFICQVTQEGEVSEAFQVKGIDTKRAWAHLRTGQDITPQIAVNTGLEPVETRLDHTDALPDRISHWLTHNTDTLAGL